METDLPAIIVSKDFRAASALSVPFMENSVISATVSRLTATGELKPCLCYGDHISIKKALRTGSPEDVRQLLTQAIYQKPAAHCFETISAVTETNEMSRIGG